MEDLETVIKQLKKGKSPGPDEFVNELIINAGTNLKKNMLDMINTFWINEEIPQELYKTDVKTLYKGKGEVANLENQRGLFLSSAIIKLYEKMIMLRASPKITEGMSKFFSC